MLKEREDSCPNVTFIYTRHYSREDADRVWEIANSADIILLETVGPSYEKRALSESKIASLKSERDPYVRESIARRLASGRSRFGKEIYSFVAQEGKEIKLIDVDKLWVGNKWGEISDKMGQFSKVAQADADFRTAFVFFRVSVFNEALYIFERDIFVSNQTKNLIEENKERWNGKRIAVIQGTFHSKTFGLFRNDCPEIPSRIAFANSDPHSLYYKTENCIIDGRREDAEKLIKRLFLSVRVIRPAVIKSKIFIPSEKATQIADRMAESLNESEVERIFAKLDDSGAEIKKRFPNDDKRSFSLRENHSKTEVIRIGKNVIQTHKKLLSEKIAQSL